MRLFIKIVVGFVILVLLYLGFVGIYFKYFYYKKDIDGITICTCIQDFMHTQEKEYRDNYYHLIEQSLKKDKKSLKELSLYDLRGATGESAYDHGDVLENRLGSHRNTIPRHLMYKSRYKSVSRTYYRFVDDSIFVSAEYGYDSKTGLLNSLFLEWRPSSELSGSRYNYKKTPFPKNLIRQKVIATINETLPCKPKKKDGDSYIWTLNGVKIDLWKSYSGIRLLIEKTK